MYNELNQHKKSDGVKWVAVFIAIIILAAGIIAALVPIYTAKDNTAPTEEQQPVENSSGEETPVAVNTVKGEGVSLMFAVPQSKVMLLSTGDASATECVTQSVTATINPASVVDKYVTWTIAWDSAAALKDQDISQYVTVTQEEEGSLTAQINCFKSFRNSKVILTCTTRQGGKKATAEIQFQGAPSSMTISSPSGISQTNLGVMSVDMLYVGESYNLNFNLANIFNDVGTNFSDFSVTVSGVGRVTCGSYSQSPRGAGWNSHSNVIDFSTIAKEFITASVTDYTLNLNVTKSLYDYYESKETKVVEGNGETTTYTNKLYSLNTDTDGNKPYFLITVKHNTLGFSAQYKCFIGEAVNSVSLNKTTVTF